MYILTTSTRRLMRVQVIFALFIVLTLADDPAKALQRNILCDLEQKALHLKLHCSLTPTTSGAWDQCSVNVDLARGVYANPYELADKLPEVKFTIARKATREADRLSRFFFAKKSVESESRQEISLNASEVDIEAPSWKSEPTRWKFALDSQRQIWGSNAAIELSIPLHLRYNLPSRSGKPGGGIVSRTLIDCSGKMAGSYSGQHKATSPSGCSSDLLLVMPLTLILLVIGIIILLLH
ncbi:hypothetical protein TcWFU_002875 [Taenia crassiceps]|uniref:Phosphatidylinositol-glycan biosynthesis class X protein n=1 Tax=Taenia crassiceps TaxID=6207 RepID=A0ABR4QPK6_9CEST